MFFVDSENEQEGTPLRSGRIFRSRKRRKIVTRRGSCTKARGEYYEITSHLDEGSCDEEEEY